MTGPNTASWNNKREDLVSDRFKVFHDLIQYSSPDSFAHFTHTLLSCCHLVFSIFSAVHIKFLLECDHRREAVNILTNDPSGPGFRYNAEHFRPEVAVISLAASLPGATERLAGEAPGKKGCSSESGSVEGEDVGDEDRAIFLNSRPGQSWLLSGVGNSLEPGGEDFLAERVNLAHRDGAESRPLCGEVEPADSREQRDVREARSITIS
jgi:hypothetical protein